MDEKEKDRCAHGVWLGDRCEACWDSPKNQELQRLKSAEKFNQGYDAAEKQYLPTLKSLREECSTLTAAIDETRKAHAEKEIALLDLCETLGLSTAESNALLAEKGWPSKLAARLTAANEEAKARIKQLEAQVIHPAHAIWEKYDSMKAESESLKKKLGEEVARLTRLAEVRRMAEERLYKTRQEAEAANSRMAEALKKMCAGACYQTGSDKERQHRSWCAFHPTQKAGEEEPCCKIDAAGWPYGHSCPPLQPPEKAGEEKL